jgi:hypothetical protein
MKGIFSSASICFDEKSPLTIGVHPFPENTLYFHSSENDGPGYVSLYITATLEQFRQIGMKCLEFADELELKKNETKEAPAA